MPDPADPIEQLIADIKYTHGEGFLTAEQEEFWRSTLAIFAADIVGRILPDDPVAQADVINKAQALGIDLGGEDGPPPDEGNVIQMPERWRRKR